MSDNSKPDLATVLGNIAEHEACDARERMIASATFRSAPQLASFLNYIVKTTMLGRQHEIKGYTIAVEALGRPDDFDPVADPIVRVEAGRLRRAIDAYYAREGVDDPVRIVVERGSYVPRFERAASGAADGKQVAVLSQITLSAPVAVPAVGDMSPASAVAASGAGTVAASRAARASDVTKSGRLRWTLAVAAGLLAVAGVVVSVAERNFAGMRADTIASLEPLTSVAQRQPTIQVSFVPGPDETINEAGRQYNQQLSDALSRFDDFTVLKIASGGTSASSLQPTYRIEFSAEAQGPDKVTTALRLFDVANGRVVFASTGEFPRSTLSSPDQIKEIARLNAVRIAQPYGRIYSDLRLNGTGGRPVQCIVKTYDYWTSPSAGLHAEARACLEATVKADPNYHPAWALLAMIHLDEYRIGYNPRPGAALDRARKASYRAVALAPESARALQSLMAVLTVSGETTEALKAGFEAVRRNPFDTDILADLGARLTQAGRAREGRPLLLRAAEVNRARPVWHEFYLYLSAREVGDAEGERMALKALELAEAPLALLAQALAASDKGERQKSMEAMRRLSNISPVFGDNAGEFLDRAFFATNIRAMLLDALVRGGLNDLGNG